MGQFLSVSEAAERLGVNRSTIYRWVDRTLAGDLDMPVLWPYIDRGAPPEGGWFFIGQELDAWFEKYLNEPRVGRNPGE